ncbi:uncharacterized protein BDCG_16311 [Blastomyces dermatitidis ER-3]|uniref:Uncharacterized protein n=1 Tax=Ajellomyces dermatitidis (strain ER-3 / ATCC MYA-2586) TaxID=559297 RepID=A0ABX2VRC1_AJEDR|nr:uncharacterized protein BDCG_16311 [Blastomyces dermatitidis ER-3]OAS99787.1 hypothetical protein BDCG_16311 [Blastomyces dermatitidis ER-3]
MPVNMRLINREETTENQIAGSFSTSITARRQRNNQAQDNPPEREDMKDHDEPSCWFEHPEKRPADWKNRKKVNDDDAATPVCYNTEQVF